MKGQGPAQRFDSAACCLSDGIFAFLQPLPASYKQQVQEIRLRLGRPLSLHTGKKHLFVGMDTELYDIPNSRCCTVTYSELNESFKKLCDYSVHSHLNEIKDGYISVKGGHRAGICGTAVISREGITGLRDITSINLRIAKEIYGAAEKIVQLFTNKPRGMLLAGSPSSGKTTVLRDLARQLGSGNTGEYYKVAVIDERGELGASSGGIIQNDLGFCTDILTGYPKGDGILYAVRSLSPQVIICDEIGTEDEIRAVQAGLNSGAIVIASVHAGNCSELISRPQMRYLLSTGAFEDIIFLHGSDRPSEIKEICKVGELCAEDSGDYSGLFKLSGDRINYGLLLKQQSENV